MMKDKCVKQTITNIILKPCSQSWNQMRLSTTSALTPQGTKTNPEYLDKGDKPKACK